MNYLLPFLALFLLGGEPVMTADVVVTVPPSLEKKLDDLITKGDKVLGYVDSALRVLCGLLVGLGVVLVYCAYHAMKNSKEGDQ